METRNLIKWQGKDFEHEGKKADWFLILGMLSITGIVISVMVKNFSFALVIAIAGFALFVFSLKKPKEITYELNERGLLIDTVLYPYSSLESFWVDEESHEYPQLLIIAREGLAPQLNVSLKNVDPDSVRSFLLNHLEEEFQREALAQRIMRYLGL